MPLGPSPETSLAIKSAIRRTLSLTFVNCVGERDAVLFLQERVIQKNKKNIPLSLTPERIKLFIVLLFM
jgi:hypothetical protein